jgi:hypothetical protein
LVLSVPYTRAFTEQLRAMNLLRTSIISGAVVLLLWAAYAWRHHWHALSWKRRWIFILGFLAYGFVVVITGVMPEERMHFIQVTVLSALYWSALLDAEVPSTPAALAAAAMGGAVGVIEEISQLYIPLRQFDWRDIGMNLFAASCSGLLLRLLDRRT